LPYNEAKILVAVSSQKLSAEIGDTLAAKDVGEFHVAHTMYEAVELMHDYLFSLFIVDGQLLVSNDNEKMRLAGVDFIRFIRMCEGPVSEAAIAFLRSTSQVQNILEASAEIMEAHEGGASCIISQPLTPEKFEEAVDPILKQPRTFIRARDYTGPCRRRKTIQIDHNRRTPGNSE